MTKRSLSIPHVQIVYVCMCVCVWVYVRYFCGVPVCVYFNLLFTVVWLSFVWMAPLVSDDRPWYTHCPEFWPCAQNSWVRTDFIWRISWTITSILLNPGVYITGVSYLVAVQVRLMCKKHTCSNWEYGYRFVIWILVLRMFSYLAELAVRTFICVSF